MADNEIIGFEEIMVMMLFVAALMVFTTQRQQVVAPQYEEGAALWLTTL